MKEGTLYKKIQEDKDIFRKNKDTPSLDAIRFIIGEFQRDPKKDYSNGKVKETLRIIRKNMVNSPEPDHLVISFVNVYIGLPVASGDVIEWLKDNDYDKDKIMAQKNPFVIIGILKKAFGERELDGNMVKDVLANIISGVVVDEKPIMVEDCSGLMQDFINDMYPNIDDYIKEV